MTTVEGQFHPSRGPFHPKEQSRLAEKYAPSPIPLSFGHCVINASLQIGRAMFWAKSKMHYRLSSGAQAH